ncbi:hypothetical protein [Pseudomarimonas salicorniae]|uniref:Uncharacterized protein n=1 Tax=Pseudomarimonas salicorniae TaxID=2933270 RepID=A0ABT0GGW6_9GAMM|nr:hypothetical protein [Lysobacter sp. CAU 1642]MCK7593778.1 hypothetical protein [Lysobacter sp. CAU 1642]
MNVNTEREAAEVRLERALAELAALARTCLTQRRLRTAAEDALHEERRRRLADLRRIGSLEAEIACLLEASAANTADDQPDQGAATARETLLDPAAPGVDGIVGRLLDSELGWRKRVTGLGRELLRCLARPTTCSLRRLRNRAAVRGSCLFDEGWYLWANPDVRTAGLDPVTHYLCHGAREGREPGPLFSAAGYLSRHPDVAASGQNPLLHYLLSGRAEGRAVLLLLP